jgi:hypothetical protein
MSDQVTIRPALQHETPLILEFVRELAQYERLEEQVVAGEAQMRAALFGPRPYAEVVFVCCEAQPVGFALFSGRPFAAGGWGAACLHGSRSWRSSGAAAAWNGRCSTGTRPPSASIAAWARLRWRTGRCSA